MKEATTKWKESVGEEKKMLFSNQKDINEIEFCKGRRKREVDKVATRCLLNYADRSDQQDFYNSINGIEESDQNLFTYYFMIGSNLDKWQVLVANCDRDIISLLQYTPLTATSLIFVNETDLDEVTRRNTLNQILDTSKKINNSILDKLKKMYVYLYTAKYYLYNVNRLFDFALSKKDCEQVFKSYFANLIEDTRQAIKESMSEYDQIENIKDYDIMIDIDSLKIELDQEEINNFKVTYENTMNDYQGNNIVVIDNLYKWNYEMDGTYRRYRENQKKNDKG